MLHELFSPLELELLERRVRAYSRGIHGAGSANLHRWAEPVLTFPPRPGALPPLGFSSVGSASLSFSLLLPLLPPNFSFSSSYSFLPLPSLPSGPVLLSCPAALLPPPELSAASTRPDSCSSPGGLQRTVLRRPLGSRTARALPVRSGGRKRPGSRGEWTLPRPGAAPAGGCLGLESRGVGGASFLTAGLVSELGSEAALTAPPPQSPRLLLPREHPPQSAGSGAPRAGRARSPPSGGGMTKHKGTGEDHDPLGLLQG